jgi:Protein of unknown function (DUF1634)
MNGRTQPDALEVMLGRVLGAGVTSSTVALGAGLISALVVGTGRVTNILLTSGVLMLIATPVARVVISSIAYVRRRDWMFAVLTLIVLAELVASVVAAFK